MPNADRLSEFVTIVDRGSIAAGAEELGIPRATLSRRLKALEEELGVVLLNRATRRFGLTAAGERLIEHARSVVQATQEAWRSVQLDDEEPRGELRISLPPTHAFKSMMIEFATRYPQVNVMLLATSRHLDLYAEAVDLALRVGEVDDDTLIARRLVSDQAQVYGAPVYFERMGRPTSPSELIDHQCIVRFDGGWRPRTHWPLRAGGDVPVQARLTTNELITRLDAAITGMGLALLPSHLARSYVRSQQLELVLPETIGERTLMQLVYSSKRMLLPQARAFIDFAVETFSAELPDLDGLPAPVEAG